MHKLLKGIVERIPYGVGKYMVQVPFSWRLGNKYTSAKEECSTALKWQQAEKEHYSIDNFKRVFDYARRVFPCYRELYEKAGVGGLEIKTLLDIRKVPTIDKTWAREHFHEFSGAYKLNTGGSSGTPTPFWMDRGCWAREWAHMHTIWEMLGYNYRDLKLAIRGRNLGKQPFVYNAVHNEFIINTYMNVLDYQLQLKKLFGQRDIKWFHGYPSSIYQFILECEGVLGKEETRQLFNGVRGMLLSSEYPLPYMTKKFDDYGLAWISWYGHSEMCILAYDRNCTNQYRPFITYGMAEIEDGHLLGTSFHNYSMPLIRYDTGDLVEALERTEGGLVTEFAIREGREGDFIEDRNGKKIPLTALIFGRHHRAFDVADYIQIGQTSPGNATLYVTIGKDAIPSDIKSYFDLSNVDVNFDIKIIKAPIRTTMGKLKLRVSDNL